MKTYNVVAVIASLAAAALTISVVANVAAGAPERTAKHAAEVKTYDAETAAKATAAKRAQVELNVACGSKVDVAPVDATNMRHACEDLVRSELKSPSSANFPRMENREPVNLGCNSAYVGVVEAKNAFGVELRNRFVCTYDPRTASVSVKVSR